MKTRSQRNSSRQSVYLAGFILAMAGQFAFAGSESVIYNDRSVENERPKALATQISKDNVADLQSKGPDAIGGIGDWFISNGVLCAVVSDTEHEGEFSDKGGSLIDLGFCGRADDHFSFTHDLIDGSRRRPLDAKNVSIKDYNGNASIEVQSVGDGAILVTNYYFDSSSATQLHIAKRYQRSEGGSFSFLSPLNFNYHSLEPFVFNSENTLLSNGFQNRDFVKRGVNAIRDAARNADTLITISPRTAEQGISYGWRMASAERVKDRDKKGERYELPYFVLADTDGIAFMLLTDTFYIGDGRKIGWVQLPQIPLLNLSDDAAIETHEIVYVGMRGDVASITDQLLSEQPLIIGSIDDADSAIHIIQDNGAPLTHLVPDQDGHFSFRAPAGAYTLKALGRGSRQTSVALQITETDQDLGQIELPKAAQLTLPEGQAMRLVFVGIYGTETPDFSNELTEASVAFDDHIETKEGNSAVFLAGVGSDRKHVNLAAGDYRVYATKGPEFSLEQTEIKLAVGEKRVLNIKPPQRVLDTPNHIASDLHVHSGLSFDNTFAEKERVRTFVAEHGEVMVASEHDLPTDYTPYIHAMGVADKIVSIPAVEITSLLPNATNPYTGGHANAFPIEPRSHEFRNGMIAHEGKRMRDTLHSLRRQHGDPVVQLNHPRGDLRLSGRKRPSDWEDIIDDGHYLDHMGSAGQPYNPHSELHTHPNNTLTERHPETGLRDLDFDLIEVVNPSDKNNDERTAAVRLDWLSFIKQGEKIVGTANSDSHNALEQVAVPRTMVAMSNDKIADFNQEEFITNLRAGRAYGTTGPMLEISLSDTQMGETYAGVRGTLLTEINKAPWVPLERLEIQINGKTVATHPLSDQDKQVLRIPLEFKKDSFVTVEVFGPSSRDYSAIYPRISPYAFSNPIYVDFDQNGKWQAPGL